MSSPVSSSSRLRWLTRFLRWAAGALGLALVFTALVWGAWLWAMPRLDGWRPAMEAWASKHLGLSLHMAQVSAKHDGVWNSWLTFTDVRLQAPNGQLALSLPRLDVRVSPASLWRQTVDRVELLNPQLDIWRDKTGKLWVGGVALPEAGDGQTSDARIWNALLQARRLRIHDGTLHWRDERLDSEGLALSAVNLDWRNRSHHHTMRLSVTPPADWGAPFSGTADLRTPLWRPSSVDGLSGTASMQFPDLRVTALRRHLDAGVDLQSAHGELTVTADVLEGTLKQAALAGTVSRIQARFSQDLTPLDLRDVAGRLMWQPQKDGFTLTGEGLRFVTAGGQAWNDAKVRVHSQGLSSPQGTTELQAERVNLAALRHVLGTLPLDPSVRAAMRRHAVTGWVQQVDAAWSRDARDVLRYRAKGKASGLSVAAAAGIPGMQGLNAEFSFDETGGQAQLGMDRGRLSFPNVFAEPDIPVETLSTKATWTLAGEDWTVRLKDLKLRNDDAQGEFDAEWRTLPVAELPKGASRFPGRLDLRGNLSQANGARVYRYLPQAVGQQAIRYVREAVQQGQARQVSVRVQGDLKHFPFAGGQHGTFRIAAPVQGVHLNYVPKYLQSAGEPVWPALVDLQGLLTFEGVGMRVERASSRVQGLPGIRLDSIETQIPDLAHTQVLVQAKGSSEVASGLRFVQTSPVAQWLGGALDGMQATGEVGLRLGLQLPIADIHHSKVQGDVILQGNEVSLLASVPRLTAAQGRVHFTEQGFALQDVQAHGVGGLVHLTGGTEAGEPGQRPTVIRAQGVATAQGLRDEPTLDFLRPLLRQASGESDYQVAYTVAQGQVRVQVESALQGMGLAWPAPLNKPEQAAWPLTVAIDPRAGGDELRVQVGDWLAARYAREDQGKAAMRVRAGALALGAAAVARQVLPASGVALQVRWPELNAQAWRQAWQEQGKGNAVSATTADFSGGNDQYLPQSFDVRLGAVHDFGQTVAQLHVQGALRGGRWQAEVSTKAAAGQVVFSPEGSGHVRMRLKHLHVPHGDGVAISDSVNADLARTEAARKQTAPSMRWPSLDVVVDDLRLGDKPLGRLNLQANYRQGGEDDGTWLLKHMSLDNPGARLNASGAWLPPDAKGERETRLQFELLVDDGGELLRRLNMPDVVKGGSGVLHGVVGWRGSATVPRMDSLKGEVHAELVQGQFLKADPGLAKLLGVLSLQSLPRRLSLDFRDVFSDGFAFDFIRGDAQIATGQIATNNLQMKGVNAAVLMAGQANLQDQTQDLRVLVVPRIDAGGAALVATMINPAVGLGTFVAQLVLSQQINAAATRTLHITGDWADPQVQQLPGNALQELAPPTSKRPEPASAEASAS